jgi:hypothetical protein
MLSSMVKASKKGDHYKRLWIKFHLNSTMLPDESMQERIESFEDCKKFHPNEIPDWLSRNISPSTAAMSVGAKGWKECEEAYDVLERQRVLVEQSSGSEARKAAERTLSKQSRTPSTQPLAKTEHASVSPQQDERDISTNLQRNIERYPRFAITREELPLVLKHRSRALGDGKRTDLESIWLFDNLTRFPGEKIKEKLDAYFEAKNVSSDCLDDFLMRNVDPVKIPSLRQSRARNDPHFRTDTASARPRTNEATTTDASNDTLGGRRSLLAQYVSRSTRPDNDLAGMYEPTATRMELQSKAQVPAVSEPSCQDRQSIDYSRLPESTPSFQESTDRSAQTTYKDATTAVYAGFRSSQQQHWLDGNASRQDYTRQRNYPNRDETEYMGGYCLVKRSDFQDFLPPTPRVSRQLRRYDCYGLDGKRHNGMGIRDPELNGQAERVTDHWLDCRAEFYRNFSQNGVHYVSPLTASMLHPFHAMPPTFKVRGNIIGSVYQGLTLATLFWHGIFRDNDGVYDRARQTTHPQELKAMIEQNTKDHLTEAPRTRAFYESGKALAVLKNIYADRFNTSYVAAQALLDTKDKLICVLGHDLFWETGTLKPPQDTANGIFDGFNWGGVALMYIRQMLWKRKSLSGPVGMSPEFTIEERAHASHALPSRPDTLPLRKRSTSPSPTDTTESKKQLSDPPSAKQRRETPAQNSQASSNAIATQNSFSLLGSLPTDDDELRSYLGRPSTATLAEFIQARNERSEPACASDSSRNEESYV